MSKNIRLPRQIDHFEIHLVDHCNLNCKSCLHYAPCADGTFYLSLEMWEKELIRIKEIFEEVPYDPNFYLMGGEPLLHPQFFEILELGLKHFNARNFQVVSNGIELLNKDDAWFERFNKTGISFRLSDYKLNPKIRELVINKMQNRMVYRTDNFKHAQLNLEPKYDAAINGLLCDSVPGGITPCLKEGYLYPCPKIAYKNNLEQKFNVTLGEPCEHYGLNIFEANAEQIKEYLRSTNDFCAYCDCETSYTLGARIKPKRQPDEQISLYEWIKKS